MMVTTLGTMENIILNGDNPRKSNSYNHGNNI